MIQWALIGLGVLVFAVVTPVIVGTFLPRAHTASAELRLAQPPEAVWAVVSDFERAPQWRRGLKRMERLPDQEGCPVWREHGRQGRLTYRVESAEPPRRLVTRIADPSLPFGGRWIYEIHPSNGGCRVRITEQGEVYPPLFRVLSRFVFGHRATINGYLRDLAARFGESSRPVALP